MNILDAIKKAEERCLATTIETCSGECPSRQDGRQIEVCAHLLAEELTKAGAVIMPCNVGDTVYVLMGDRYTFGGKITRVTHWKVEPQIVTEISRKMGRSNKIGAWGIISSGTRRSFATIGHTVFFNQQEAEEMAEKLNKEMLDKGAV